MTAKFCSDYVCLNILVVGTGMYVGGRGIDGYGTVSPAIYEWRRRGNDLGDVYSAGAHPEGIVETKKKVKELNKLFDFDVGPKYFSPGRN